MDLVVNFTESCKTMWILFIDSLKISKNGIVVDPIMNFFFGCEFFKIEFFLDPEKKKKRGPLDCFFQ